MSRRYVFADESGNFDFSRKRDATRYFILTTITTRSCAVGQKLLELRRDLAWEDLGLGGEFHATTDSQAVRDRVFATVAPFEFRVDATVIEKAKADPQIRCSEERFYQHAWYYHMKYLAPTITCSDDEVLLVAASLGTHKRRQVFRTAIEDVMQQVSGSTPFRVASWAAASEPCLQVADYCSWAVQRKWERGDSRSYDLIKRKIKSEYDLFARGSTLYY